MLTHLCLCGAQTRQAQLILPTVNNNMDNETLHQLSCFCVFRCESIDSLVANVHIDGRMEKIDSFCGSTVPKPLMSNGPRLMLEFRGIYSSRYSRGFKATYSFTESELYYGMKEEQLLSLVL